VDSRVTSSWSRSLPVGPPTLRAFTPLAKKFASHNLFNLSNVFFQPPARARIPTGVRGLPRKITYLLHGPIARTKIPPGAKCGAQTCGRDNALDSSRGGAVHSLMSSSPRRPRTHRSAELRRQIVEQTLPSGASVSLVVRAYDVNANR
jgi:hypothetical protein